MTAIRFGAADPLVVRVAPYTGAPAPREAPHEATIGVAVGDPALAAALTRAIGDALAGAAHALPALPILAVRSRKRLAARAAQAAGAIVIVAVTARNARHLVALVEAARAAGARGVQLVWDGEAPPRAAVEHHVFAALEHARATPAAPPVVLAAHAAPAAALALVIAAKGSPR